jgi:hypothetical protein
VAFINVNASTQAKLEQALFCCKTAARFGAQGGATSEDRSPNERSEANERSDVWKLGLGFEPSRGESRALA